MPNAMHSIVEGRETRDPAPTLQEHPPKNENREEREQGQLCVYFTSLEDTR